MKNPFLNIKRKEKIVLSENQRVIIEWLIRHSQETAYSTWQLLFGEREIEQPDKCIVYYDKLSREEKINVELIIARYFSLYQQGIHVGFSSVFEDLTYEE